MATVGKKGRRGPVAILLATLICVGQGAEPPRVDHFTFTPRDLAWGDTARAFCTVSKGDLPLSIVWLHNGQDIKRNNVEMKSMDDMSASLRITNLDVGDIGNYTCVARNVAGRDSYTTLLKFESPPKWTTYPPDHIDILVNTPTVLQCQATGYPLPTAQWYISDDSDGLLEIAANDVRKRVLENGTLTIRDVNQHDSGKYVCVVENGVGEKLKAVVNLRVHEPPFMITEFQSLTSKKGEMTRIKCRARGEPPIFWEWSKDNRKQVSPHGERFETSEEHKPGYVSSELVIRETKTADAGLYLCTARNKFGDASVTLQITVLEPPEGPTNIKVSETGSRFARLIWSPSNSGNSPVLRYNVRYWTNDGKGRKLQEVEIPRDTATVLEKLHPGVRYNVIITAENLVGEGPPSRIVEFTTTEEGPNAPPTDITIYPADATVMKISWKPPPKESWNGHLSNYQIGYRKRSTELAYRFETVRATEDFKKQEMSVSNLEPATQYDVIVRAINGAGTGPWSPETLAHTSRGEHPRTPVLKIVSSTSHSLQIEWDVPGISTLESVKQFLLEFGKGGKINQKVHIPGSKRSLLLRGLEDNVRYYLRLASCNEHGQSPFSSVKSETTMQLQQEAIIQEAEATPFYLRLYFIVPMAVSVTVVVSTLVVAWACVARTKALEAASHLLREPAYEYKVPIGARGHINSATLQMHKQHQPGVSLEEAYDLPWDMAVGADGANYTRLGGDIRRPVGTLRMDNNRRSR